jgi:hypothetical protein
MTFRAHVTRCRREQPTTRCAPRGSIDFFLIADHQAIDRLLGDNNDILENYVFENYIFFEKHLHFSAGMVVPCLDRFPKLEMAQP